MFTRRAPLLNTTDLLEAMEAWGATTVDAALSETAISKTEIDQLSRKLSQTTSQARMCMCLSRSVGSNTLRWRGSGLGENGEGKAVHIVANAKCRDGSTGAQGSGGAGDRTARGGQAESVRGGARRLRRGR